MGWLESMLISLLVGLCIGGAGGFYVGWNFTQKNYYVTEIQNIETRSDIQNVNRNQTQVISGQYLLNYNLDKTNIVISTNITDLTNSMSVFLTNTNYLESRTNYTTNRTKK